MPEPNCRLTAIMAVRRNEDKGGTATYNLNQGGFTNIICNTTLIGNDEDWTFQLLHKNKEVKSTLFKPYNSTLSKGMSVEKLTYFKSASDALRHAIAIQKSCKMQSIQLQIGIHKGEMILERPDVLGDVLNVKFRLESIVLTEPKSRLCIETNNLLAHNSNY